MPSKNQNLIFHWFHIFILIFKNLDSISNYIKIDVLNRYFHSKMHFLFVYMLHTIVNFYFTDFFYMQLHATLESFISSRLPP